MNPVSERLTSDELQQAIFMCGSMTAFYQWLGISASDGRKFVVASGLKSPFDWLREQSSEGLCRLVAELGSIDAVSERYGCSPAFLKSLIAQRLERPSKLAVMKAEELQKEIERVGSVRLLAYILGETESKIRRALEEAGIAIPRSISYEGTKFSNGKGRTAELLFKSLRGPNILRDLNLDESNQADIDFEDAFFGAVDVKGSQQHRRANGDRYWKFSVEYSPTCRHYAFMCMNQGFDKMEWWFVLDSSFFKSKAKFTFTVEERLRKFVPIHLQSQSPYGVNVNALMQCTNIASTAEPEQADGVVSDSVP